MRMAQSSASAPPRSSGPGMPWVSTEKSTPMFSIAVSLASMSRCPGGETMLYAGEHEVMTWPSLMTTLGNSLRVAR